MVVNSRHFTNAKVLTKSGTHIGKATSLDFDADTGKLTTLHVRPTGVTHLLEEFLVAWAQIISLSEDEVIIDDAAVPSGQKSATKPMHAPAVHLTQHGNA